MSCRSIVLALAVLAACGGSKPPPHRPGDDYLKAIKIEGNAKLETSDLEAGLALKRTQKRGGAPDPYLVSIDGDRIRGAYLRKGYLSANVKPRVERAGDASTVIYAVDEGPRSIARVSITGVPAGDPDLTVAKVRAALPLKDGSPFDYEIYDLHKAQILGVAKDAGYAYATLDSTVLADRGNHVAVVQLDFTPGPKCVFGDTKVVGATGKLADAIRGRLQFKPGQTYSNKALSATQRQLYALQRFSTVQVASDVPNDKDKDKRGTSTTVSVKADVSQAARREVKLGGGFGIDPTAYEVRGRAGYSIVGWPFQMHTVTIDLRPAYAYMRDGSGFQPRIRALAKLDRQDLIWTYAVGTVLTAYDYLALEAYTYTGPRAGLAFQKPVFSQKLNAQIGWGLQRVDFLSVSPLVQPIAASIGITKQPQLIGAYVQGLTLDLRDNPIETTEGFYAAFNLSEGSKAAGGDFNYIEAIPEVRGYQHIRGVVFAAKARAGAFFGATPATERFFAGGATSQRGFGERQLSPQVTGDVNGSPRTVPYGGAGLVETSVEARIPITSWRGIGIGSVLFLDGGDVTEKAADLNLGNLHWAVGTGLRLKTIVGPIRADFGYRLNRKTMMDPAPGSSFAFHLSLGEAF